MPGRISQPYSSGRMGFQAVLEDVEASNFDRFCKQVYDWIMTRAAEANLTVIPVGDEDVTVTYVGGTTPVYEWSALTDHRAALLPSLADVPVGAVFYFHRKVTDFANVFRVVADSTGSDTIDGLSTYATSLPSGSFGLLRGTSSWTVIDERLVDQIYRGIIENPNVGGTENASMRVVTAAGGGQPFFRLLQRGGRQFDWSITTGASTFVDDLGNQYVTMASGDTVVGLSTTLAANATGGWLWTRYMAGRPTGTPAVAWGSRAPLNIDITNHRLDTYYGSAWESLPLRCLNVQIADVGTFGLGPDDLHTFALPAGVLSRNGESIELEYTITTIGDIDPATVEVYFGATLLIGFTASPSSSAGDTFVRSRIYRTGATTQRATTTWHSTATNFPASSVDYTTPAETLANSITVKCTGDALSGVNNVVVCKLSSVRFIPLGV